MNKLISSLTIIVVLFITSCNNIKELEYKGIKKTSVQKASFNDVAVQVDLAYYNPNNFGLDVKDADLKIYVDDQFVGLADQPTVTKIQKNSEFVFPVIAHFDPMKIMGSALKTLMSNKVNLGIKGTAKIGKGGLFIPVPINVTETISLRN